MNYNLITILGPTAVGKTKLAAQLAFDFKGEIISADSRQVYVGMDIGTGKDLADYTVGNTTIPFFLIDVISPREEFSLFQFQNLFYEYFGEISERKNLPFLVGGTGLYINSILKSYELHPADFNSQRAEYLATLSMEELKKILMKINPKLHNTTDLLDTERIIKAIIITESENGDQKIESGKKITPFVLGISENREKIKANITKRLKERLDSGMIEEVEKLLNEGVSEEKMEFFGLEYKYVSRYIGGKLNYNDMFQKLNSSIHKFAKRQMTWFRKMEREGIKIHWLEGPDYKKAKQLLSDIKLEY